MQGGEALENKAQTCKPVMGTRVRASKGAGTSFWEQGQWAQVCSLNARGTYAITTYWE